MQKMKKITIDLLLALFVCLSLVSCIRETPTELVWKDLTWAVGAPLPHASDFVAELPDGYTARFAEEYRFQTLGEYELCVILTDARGRESEHNVKFTLVIDNEPPVMEGVTDLSVYVGDGISYRSGVSLSDNCDGEITLSVDSSAVDHTKEGVYTVCYTATDAAGNETVKEIQVYIYQEKVTEQMLYTELDRIIAREIPTSADKETQARAVYSYVYYSISYDESSDKSDWVRAAYEGLRTGKGDCFTYFALSKAFFERLGIENMDIQRTTGIVDERHYWNLVNIGSSASPRWYHFDACRINGERETLGLLMTDKQMQAYTALRVDKNGVGNYFYAFDSASYPATEQMIITRTDYD